MNPRLAARALIVRDDKLLLVNATPEKGDGKWCTPGGGTKRDECLPDGLGREVFEETGLELDVGDIAFVSEFFDPPTGFHQVDIFFHCVPRSCDLPENWRDTASVVERRGFFTLAELRGMMVFPDCLKSGFWLTDGPSSPVYKGFELKK